MIGGNEEFYRKNEKKTSLKISFQMKVILETPREEDYDPCLLEYALDVK